MCYVCKVVSGHDYMIALSVFATKNDDRFELTYREFANMLRAIDFTDHPTDPGLLRPPRRFRRFEKGTLDFPYNPKKRDLDSNMSYRMQHEMKMLLREYYEMTMHYFLPMPYNEWAE